MHKAVHTPGGVWPTARVLLFKGGAGVGPQSQRSEVFVEHNESKQKVWMCTHKAGHTQGGAHTTRSVATAGVLLFEGGAGVGSRVERSKASVERNTPQKVE